MGVESLIVWLLIGAIAGWLAGLIVKGYGFGILGNIVVGIIGAAIGGWIFSTAGVFPAGSGIVGAIVSATVGAVVLLLLIGFVRRVA